MADLRSVGTGITFTVINQKPLPCPENFPARSTAPGTLTADA
jgi:hypothetical protein